MTTGVRTGGDGNKSYYYKWWEGYPDGDHTVEHFYQSIIETYNLRGEIFLNGEWQEILPAPAGGPHLVDEYNLRLLALADIAEKIRNTGLDLGNTIGEGKQTINQAYGALKSLAAAARSLKKGDVYGAARALGQPPSSIKSLDRTSRRRLQSKDISSQWLGLSYGWVPLLSDVYEAATEWERVTSAPRKFHFRKRRRHVDSYVTIGSGANDWRVNRKISVEARVTVVEHMDTSRRLGLQDPLGVAWELVPWSFVVDWFVPISTYLDTLNTFSGLNAFVAYTTYQKYEASWIKSQDYRNFGGNYLKLAILREPSGGISVPTPRIAPPETWFSPKRLANAIALAHQAFSK